MSKTFNGCAFNYSGSKSRHMETLYKLLPIEENISCLDLFNGGNSLGSQLPLTWKTTANDIEHRLTQIHKAFQEEMVLGTSPEELCGFIKTFCHSWMNKTNKCDKEQYLALRNQHNLSKTPLLLYTLVCSSFSNQVRFNSDGDFNLPKGDRYFNSSMEKKLLQYLRNIKERNITFTSEDFRKFDFFKYDVVISDSPYLKSVASYNEGGGWSFSDSVTLLSKLDRYAGEGGKFFVFEELYSNGKPNQLLLDWATNYNIKQLGNNSDKCNYQRKGGRTQEVIIFN